MCHDSEGIICLTSGEAPVCRAMQIDKVLELPAGAEWTYEAKFRGYRASESFGTRRVQAANRLRLLVLRNMGRQRACYRYSLDL
jgi:hypothetical protein